jgi:hypothetical protein
MRGLPEKIPCGSKISFFPETPEFPFYDLTILRTFLGAASQKRRHMAAKRGMAATMASV